MKQFLNDKWNKVLKLALFLSLSFLLNSQTLLAKDQSFEEKQLQEKAFKNSITLTSKELRQSSEHILQNVPEFEFIVEEASKLGVRVFLFGGTASSFLNYAKDYTLWEKGSHDYYDINFEKDSKGHFDYTLIYRPSQDLDIVVDGSEDKIRTLEDLIENKFPYVQGEKSEWELRSLRGTYKGKTPLLGDKDFRNQHTDSHSVAMVELTKPPKGKPRIRDLRYWEQDITPMEKDILKGQVSFYFSPSHESTSRYKNGHNPPILSVIRYFIKAFQHSLIIPKEYLKPTSEISKIIQEFKPSEVEGYVGRWMERNVPKLFLHSVDVEYAWDVLEKVGLRQKLLEVGDKDTIDTPAWWMNKEPLRSKDFGKQGQTAKELGIKFVTHNTTDFHVYDVITRSKKGLPNVFISRYNSTGESAVRGDGFYTVKGKENTIYGKGFSIRFEVDPKAREGQDFKADDDIILILNKRAIRVIPEEIKVPSLYDYFVLLSEDHIDTNEKGLLEKLKRKLQGQFANISKEEQERIKDLVRLNESNSVVMREWYSLPFSKIPSLYDYFVLVSKDHIDTNLEEPKRKLQKLIKNVSKKEQERIKDWVLSLNFGWNSNFYKEWVSLPFSSKYPEVIKEIIATRNGSNYVPNFLMEHILSKPHWKGHPELVKHVIVKHYNSHGILWYVAEYVLSKPHWKDHPELVNLLITKSDINDLRSVAEYVLSQPHWKDPKLVEKLITQAKGNKRVLLYTAKYVLSKPHWKNRQKVVEQIINTSKKDKEFLRSSTEYYTLPKPHRKNHPELVAQMITGAKRDEKVLEYIAEHILSEPHWKGHPELIKHFITSGKALWHITKYVLSEPHWKDHPHLVEMLIMAQRDWGVLGAIAEYVLSKPHWKNYPHLVEKLITAVQEGAGWVPQFIAKYVLSKPHWKNHPHLVEKLITVAKGDKGLLRAIAEYALSQPHWKNHPHLVEKLITAAQGNKELLREIKANIKWYDFSKLSSKCSRLLE